MQPNFHGPEVNILTSKMSQICQKYLRKLESVIYCNPLLKTGITITKLGVALIRFPATVKGT